MIPKPKPLPDNAPFEEAKETSIVIDGLDLGLGSGDPNPNPNPDSTRRIKKN